MSQADIVLHNHQGLRLLSSVFHLVPSSWISGFYFLVQTIPMQSRKEEEEKYPCLPFKFCKFHVTLPRVPLVRI